jgi:hypothetical protein
LFVGGPDDDYNDEDDGMSCSDDLFGAKLNVGIL